MNDWIIEELGLMTTHPFSTFSDDNISSLSRPPKGCWKALCLVEDVKRNEEYAFHLKDETTRCGVVTVCVVSKELLASQTLRKDGQLSRKEKESSCVNRQKKKNRLDVLLDEVLTSSLATTSNNDEEALASCSNYDPLTTSPKKASSRSPSQTMRQALFELLSCIYEDPTAVTIEENTSLGKLISEKPLGLKHPNWLPLYLVLEGQNGLYLLFGSTKQTLESMIKFNYHTLRPAVLQTTTPPRPGEVSLSETDPCSDEQLRFVLYQILRAVKCLHDQGSYHGDLNPTNIYIGSDLWALIEPPVFQSVHSSPQTLLDSLTEKWREGELSNLDYLMAINAAAGRHMADATFHPVIPWVTDFTCEEIDSGVLSHWRDLTRSKYRLVKGDDQLDITFNNSPTPHHITESLSEITYYIYMARRTPISTLRSVVRNNFEAKEYPASMTRMYEWTPDECIPEFFLDPSVFASAHRTIDMPDLQLPLWCETPERFIQWHREALESDHVSEQLHHWIDLNFGYKLSGEAAVEAKNVTLPLSSLPAHRLRKSPGFVQVFTKPHPAKLTSGEKKGQSSVDAFENSRAFEKKFSHLLDPVYRIASSGDSCRDADDMFAVGCLVAEMYLRQPVFTSKRLQYLTENNNVVEVVPELSKLPERVRGLVLQLLNQNASRRPSAEDCLQHRKLFPPWFASVYEFLARFHLIDTWVDRLRYLKDHLDDLLISDEIASITKMEREQVVNLIKPSLFKLMKGGCDETRAEAPILMAGLLGAHVDINRDILSTTVGLYERMQTKDEWHLLKFAVEPELVLLLLKVVGTPTFLKSYLPLVLDTVTSTTALRPLRNSAVQALLVLSRSNTLGIGVATQVILKPLLAKWLQLKALSCTCSNIAVPMSYVHFQQFCVANEDSPDDEDVTLHGGKVLFLLQRIHDIVSYEKSAPLAPTSTREKMMNLVLPLQSAMAKVIRYMTVYSGRAVLMALVVPSTFTIFDQVWSSFLQTKAVRDEACLLDIISVLVCLLPVMDHEDIYHWFLKGSKDYATTKIHNLLLSLTLSPASSEASVNNLLQVYLASLLSLACAHTSKHHQLGFVLEALVPIFQKATLCDVESSTTPEILWIARILYMPFIARWDSQNIGMFFTSFKSSWVALEQLLGFPFQTRPGDITSEETQDVSPSLSVINPGSGSSRKFGTRRDLLSARGASIEDDEDDYEEMDEHVLVDVKTGNEVVVDHHSKRELNKRNSFDRSLANLDPDHHSTKSPPVDSSQPSITTAAITPGSGEQYEQQQEPKRTSSGEDEKATEQLHRQSSSKDLGESPSNATEADTAAEDAWLLGGGASTTNTKSAGLDGTVIDSFQAHTHPIVTVEVDENEVLLGTTCRGNWVKFWSITGVPKEVSSFRNSRPVSAIKMLDSGSKSVLLDGALRLYDNHTAKTIRTTSSSVLSTVPVGVAHRPILTIEKDYIREPGGENILWAATIAGTLDCIDLRTPGVFVSSHQLPYSPPSSTHGSPTNNASSSRQFQQPLATANVPSLSHHQHQQSRGKTFDPKGMTVSSLAVGGSYFGGWVAAARPSGFISVLDARVGTVLAHWKAHESAVVQLKRLNLPRPLPSLSMESEYEIASASRTTLVPDFAKYQLLSISTEGSARIWDVTLQGGFENCHSETLLSSYNRPRCRVRLFGLPTVSRYSRVLAPHRVNGGGSGGGGGVGSSESPQGGLSASSFSSRTISTVDSSITFATTPSKGSVKIRHRSASADGSPVADEFHFETGVVRRSSSVVNEHSSGDKSPSSATPGQSGGASVAGATEPLASGGTPDDLTVPSPVSAIPDVLGGGGKGSTGGSVISHSTLQQNSNRKGKGRVYVSIPQCDTATVRSCAGETMLIMGSVNRLTYVGLALRDKGTEVSGKHVVLRDQSKRIIGKDGIRINVLRALPIHNLLISGSETGHISAIL